jgi:hypothetical protein
MTKKSIGHGSTRLRQGYGGQAHHRQEAGEMENTSGLGKNAEIPPEIKGWNWGAFLLNWIWGIGNKTYIAFLMFVPFVNLVMAFVLGAKGNVWAWQNKKWDSIEHFKSVQRNWFLGSLVTLAVIVVFVCMLTAILFGVFSLMKNSEAYQLSIQRIETNVEVKQTFGEPIEYGLVQGSISTSGPRGEASLGIPLEGPMAEGTAYVEAVKEMGTWRITAMEVEIEPSGRRIVIVE